MLLNVCSSERVGFSLVFKNLSHTSDPGELQLEAQQGINHSWGSEMRRADVGINLMKHQTFQILDGVKLGSGYFKFLVGHRTSTWKEN